MTSSLLAVAGWLVLAAPSVDLSLEQAVSLALSRNERAAASHERQAAAQAREARARAFFFPELSATAIAQRNLYETSRRLGDQTVRLRSTQSTTAAAVLRLPLFDGRGIPLYRQARAEQQAADLEAREERRLLAFEAADAFLRTFAAEGVDEAARRRLSLAQQSHRESKTRFEAGLVSSNDVTRAGLELASAERDATRALGSRRTSYLELGYLLATDVEGPLRAPGPLLEAAARWEEDLAAAVKLASSRRLDLEALARRADAAAFFAQEPRWRLLPSLAAVGQYRLTSDPGLNGRPDDGFIGLELSWVLFDGGERYAEGRERRALARIQLASAEAKARRVPVEVKVAALALATAQAALRQARAAGEAAQRNAEETTVLYRQGLTGALEVADAGVRQFEAEVELASAQVALGLAWFDLRASQGLGPLEEVSR